MSSDSITARQLAEAAVRDGRIDEAIEHYQQHLADHPDDADSWFNLGYFCRARRRFEAAIAAYRAALAAGVARPEEVHLNLAVILSEHRDDWRGAESELERAMALNPGFVPGWLNLGNLREDLGLLDAAESAYREVLRHDPGNGRALGRIAMISLQQGEAQSAAQALEPLLAPGRLPHPDDRAEVLFALGHARDAAGEHARAFQAIAAANLLRKRAHPYDPRSAEALVDAIIDDPPRSDQRLEPSGSAPVFICGMFRSGSTLAEVQLQRRFGVVPCGELETLPALVRDLGQPFRNPVSSLGADQLAGLRAAYLAEISAIHGSPSRLSDKRCDNFLNIGLIKALFPDALIVHTRRDPRDTLLSLFFGNFDPSQSYTTDLAAAAHWLGQYQRVMAHWHARFPGQIFDLDYEALVSDPAAALEPLGALLGPGNPDAAGVEQRAIRTLSSWQVRQPVHGRSVGRWRNYAAELEPAIRALGLDR